MQSAMPIHQSVQSNGSRLSENALPKFQGVRSQGGLRHNAQIS
jgi:hypothetical protein